MELGWLCGALGSRLSPWLFVWQAWQSEASTSILCGRCGTWRHRLSLCVAGVALGTGLALVARLVPVCRRGSLCGRRGNRKHRPPFCVAGVALGDINFPFVWPAWHLWQWAGWFPFVAAALCQAWQSEASTSILFGRRGTWRHRPSLCVAGVALMALGWLWWRAWFPFVAAAFVWQAWQSEASTSILCGRCGTWRHQPSLCVAGVALARIHLHSVWQAWHLATSTFTLCGRRGIYGTVALCVSGVTIGSIQLDSVGEAWHLATSTFPVSGRCGICGTGLALVARLVPVCRHGSLCGHLEVSTSILSGRHVGMGEYT